MSIPLSLSVCLYRRPEDTRRVLDAVAAIPEFAAARQVVSIDKHDDQTQKALAEIAHDRLPNARIIKHGHKLGCNNNTRAALTEAFAGGPEFNIHIEDDTLPALSAGAMFSWAADKYRDDQSVFTVGAWRHADGWQPDCGREQLPGEMNMVRKQGFFNCWLWGTWKDRWVDIEKNWTKGTDDVRSWDYAVTDARGSRCEVIPMVSRAINIGHEFGTHRGAYILPFWADQTPAGEFVEG